MENQVSVYASESLNSFIEYLDEKYGSESYESEEEIKDEMLFEHFIKNKKRIGMNRSFLNTFYNKENTRRDLAEKIELKKNEPQFRKNIVAKFLRNCRKEAQNGYRDLPTEEQERILNCRLDTIRQIFGDDNIYNSRRILKYKTGPRKYKQKTLPLRKEVTTLVIRGYKPYELFCWRERKGKSIDSEEDFLEPEEYQRKHHQKHKAEILEAQRAYYQEHKAEILEAQKAYYQKHRNEILEYKRGYHQRHKDERANLEPPDTPSDTFTSASQLELCPSL